MHGSLPTGKVTFLFTLWKRQSSNMTNRRGLPGLYPEVEPHAQGILEVTGGDLVLQPATHHALGG
jgi:hypothetical protein